MKKIIYLRILFTGIFIFTLVSVSYSAEWEHYGEVPSGSAYYDKENIKHMPNNIIRVWVKNVYSDTGKKESIKNLGDRFKDVKDTLYLFQINCNEKKLSSVNVTDYDSKGSVISSDDNTTLKESIILPESVGEKLYKIVCKVTK